ncbi:hypothetical protein QEH68_19840 [Paenarthrobacter sp. OM7]|uniref:hypothetical protein n=1 Tax=unclassified Paenarthrobacter TaxID=2634190 RepID=UPI002468E175|nr:hypothetical protein [Paenarthrobacter sp. OM7]WGM20236.1 hypothetical protein QEH68_19840 [Paenarthrobacter sp. OM7]
MTAVVVRESQGGASLEVTPPVLITEAATARRTGVLDEVWTAAARVEGLQWEMDEAEDCLVRAMRNATAAGAGLPDLAIASGLGFADIERLMQ